MESTFTESNGFIDPPGLQEAIDFLKKYKKPNPEEIYSMIATLGKIIGAKVYTTEYLPKGKIIIGTGKIKFEIQ